MATAAYPLRRVQFGTESTAGTAIAADMKLSGEAFYAPVSTRWRPEGMSSERAPEARSPIDMRKASALVFESELDYEQVMLFLDTGLAAASTSGGPTYTHTYQPNLNGAPNVRSATFEYIVDDGTTKHYEREFTFGTTLRLTVDLAFEQHARMVAEVFGRSEKSSTATGGLSELSRTLVSTSDFAVYIDPTWATLGTTQKSVVIRGGSLDLMFGLAPEYTLDSRADLDFNRLDWTRVEGTLDLTFEHDGTAAAEVDAWRNRTARFIRLRATNGAKSLTFDLSGIYASEPALHRDLETELVTLRAALQLDPVSRNLLKSVVVNTISAI